MTKLTRALLFMILCGTALSVSAQFSLTIRRVSEQPEEGQQGFVSSQVNDPAQRSANRAKFKFERRPTPAIDLPYPWNSRFQKSEFYGSESLMLAGIAPGVGGTNGAGSFSLLASNVTNVLQITATPLLPEKIYQLLVASNVTGPYVPESEAIQVFSTSHMWRTTNYHPIGFYQVQEIVPPCPPTATITSPANGTVISSYDNLMVYAVASACPSNRLVRAVLFDNGIKVGWLTSSETNLTNLVFEVSTRHLAYGEHNLRVMVEDDALLDNGENGYVAYSEAITITVSNPIWFTTGEAYYDSDFFPIVTDTFYTSWCSVIGDVQVVATVHNPNGVLLSSETYNIYSEQIEANGIFSSQTTSGFFDNNGNPVYAPEPYYDLTLTVTPLPTQGFAEVGEPLYQVVKRFYTEYQMPSTTNASAIVAYQLTFDDTTAQGGQAITDLNKIRETFSLAYANPLPGAATTAFQLADQAAWIQFQNDPGLLTWNCRTLVFMGHGSPDSMGNLDKGLGMSAGRVRNRLGNFAPHNGGTNIHPYRAVFLFGCNTAAESGRMFESFLGIKQTEPKSPQNRYTLFSFHGLTPRAGLGFDSYKFNDLAGTVPHAELYQGAEQLTGAWAQRLQNGTFSRDLAGSILFSRFIRDSAGVASGVKNPAVSKVRVVGDDRINFQ